MMNSSCFWNQIIFDAYSDLSSAEEINLQIVNEKIIKRELLHELIFENLTRISPSYGYVPSVRKDNSLEAQIRHNEDCYKLVGDTNIWWKDQNTIRVLVTHENVHSDEALEQALDILYTKVRKFLC